MKIAISFYTKIYTTVSHQTNIFDRILYKSIFDQIMAFLLKKIDVNKILNKYLNHEYDTVKIIRSDKIKEYNIKSDYKIYAYELTRTLKIGSTVLCNWCSNPYTVKVQNLGIPIEGTFSLEDRKLYYKTEGIFCSYECAYALLIILKCRNPGLYINAENKLKDMYDQDYPEKNLRAANDFWLQRSHGGPMNRDDYVRSKYKQSNNRILIPVKVEYELR